MTIQNKIGAQIKAGRTEKKMSQRKLSDLSSVEQKYICNIEKGKTNITLATLEKLARALGKKVTVEIE
jgi:transcriptional regulator with XRE-family HTH domain